MPDPASNAGTGLPQLNPNLQFSVICLNLIEESGPPTFQHLFYELPFPELPCKVERFFIINCWINGRGQFRQSVRTFQIRNTPHKIAAGWKRD